MDGLTGAVHVRLRLKQTDEIKKSVAITGTISVASPPDCAKSLSQNDRYHVKLLQITASGLARKWSTAVMYCSSISLQFQPNKLINY
jgi:hypothetical protein